MGGGEVNTATTILTLINVFISSLRLLCFMSDDEFLRVVSMFGKIWIIQLDQELSFSLMNFEESGGFSSPYFLFKEMLIIISVLFEIQFRLLVKSRLCSQLDLCSILGFSITKMYEHTQTAQFFSSSAK